MNLGGVIFSISTLAYDKLTRSDAFRWVTMERLNNVPAEQFIGPGSINIELSGTIYPGFSFGGPTYTSAQLVNNTAAQIVGSANGQQVPVIGTQRLEPLRALANAGQPYQMNDARGYNFGLFVILDVNEVQSSIIDGGAPRKQEFVIKLRSYGQDDLAAYQAAQASTVAQAAATTTLNNAAQLIQGLANNPVAQGAAQALANLGVTGNFGTSAALAAQQFLSSTNGAANTPLSTNSPTAPIPNALTGAFGYFPGTGP
jgi:phage protein U